ncbi:hypothetical protein [Bacillus sp. Au-Bac7]|uniref:hypothetical protein n=1 Tax=Bacillus sp. Au-Bac7 TaxID=2906458 RepID=UPI001E4FBC61|nr:hypothetical protein [Bacillus sp. Au-Bac7]MCE4048847.1 hypothetical protein [Bacillus sp. Au-Bac7]
MKKFLLITGVTVLAGLLAFIIYNVNFKDKNFTAITNMENAEITSLEVKKMSRNSDEELLVTVTNHEEIKKIMADFRNSKWVREPQSFTAEEYYSIAMKKDKNSLGEILIIGNESFLVSIHKNPSYSKSKYFIFKNENLEIDNLFRENS